MTALHNDTDQWVEVTVDIVEYWVVEQEFHRFTDTIAVNTAGKTDDQIMAEAINEAEYGLVYHPCQPVKGGDVVRMSLNTTTSTITTTTKEN